MSKSKRGMKIHALATLYMSSPQWMQLAPSSRQIYERAMVTLSPLMDANAHEISRQDIVLFTDSIWHKGATCRLAIQTLSNILSFGYDRGMVPANHARGIKYQPKAEPYLRWSDEECGLFIKTAPAYLRRAFLMSLYTGQRRGDVIRMKWDAYKGGEEIMVRQEKTGRFLYIPVHPQLKAELDAIKGKKVMIQMGKKEAKPSPYILHNHNGDPMQALGYTQAVKKHAVSIGITDKSLHGLRKTAGATLAELGCSPHQIAAILGHTTLKEIMKYTEQADQRSMAQEAMAQWALANSSLDSGVPT